MLRFGTRCHTVMVPMLVRDYAHLFKWNPSGMVPTQEMYRTPRT
eukprot:SAG31_NODE_1839_length_7124_cov_5.833310_8_plen_43_part_01